MNGSIDTGYKYKVLNKCPICKNNNIIRKGRQGTGDIVVHPQVFKCCNCNIYFVNPIIELDSLYRLYDDFDNIYKQKSSSEIAQIKRNVSYWNKLFSNKNSRETQLYFLDVGSASGELVNEFISSGWEAHGIEPSKGLVELSINNFRLNNIKHSTVEEAEYPNNHFDLIHFWHVLEHVLDPKKVLDNIYNWLKPGGMVNLGTPSPDSIITKIYPIITGIYDLGSMHTFIFPSKSLLELLKSIGFEIDLHTIYSRPRSGDGIKIRIHNTLHKI